MEHLHHFHLKQDPFQNEPDLRFYFNSATHREAQLRVERGLRQNKGLTVLTGAGGTGKTLLARRILDALEEELFEVGLMVMLPGAAGADSVLTRIARQLNVEEPAAERGALLAQIYEQLAIVREDGRYTVLILDDAQVLSRGAMAELGGLLNLEYEDRRLMSLLAVGLPELDLAIAKDSSLSQRVDVRVRLESLDFQNAAAYLAHRLAAVGGSPEIFGEDAIQALFKLGRGRPRLLNTLADNALFEAYLARRPRVDPCDVDRAAADLGIGPDPGNTFSGITEPGAQARRARSRASASGASGATADRVPREATGAPTAEGLADPASGPATELSELAVAGENVEVTSDQLGELLDAVSPVDEELTSVLDPDRYLEGPSCDLEAEVGAALGEASLDSLAQDVSLDDEAMPVFEGKGTGSVAQAEATCVVLQDEAVPEKDPSEEIDDLFVELMDD